jgi:transcription elongation factor GreB
MKNPLVTREGYESLKEELDYLWRVERREVTAKVTWAAGLGDRSENADYQYNKKRLRVIDYHPDQAGKIYFGAHVVLVDDDGREMKFRIVGVDEIYGKQGCVSINSPAARACLGKEIDDEVEIVTPDGRKLWYVESFSYNR